MFTSNRIRKAAKAFKESLKKADTKNKTTDKPTPAKAKEDKSKKEIKK